MGSLLELIFEALADFLMVLFREKKWVLWSAVILILFIVALVFL